MSAVDDLRRAATLLRERAEAARRATASEVWRSEPNGTSWTVWGTVEDDWRRRVGVVRSYDAAAHIAALHPGVALALADWLDTVAVYAEAVYAESEGYPPGPSHALAVARAYLGEQS